MAAPGALRDSEAGIDETDNEAQTRLDDVTAAVTKVADKFGEKADEVVHYAAGTYHGAKHIAARNLGDIERQIRERPVQAALIAAGAGLLIGIVVAQGNRYSHVGSGFDSPGRRRMRMTRKRLPDEINNQIARAGHAWDSIHDSDRIRDIARYLGAQRRRWLS
jgi:ElaB/YqjD/DUF883 family membrane-anchored ribosome-binding protein